MSMLSMYCVIAAFIAHFAQRVVKQVHFGILLDSHHGNSVQCIQEELEECGPRLAIELF